MQFDYAIYVFVLIGFIYGLYRGIKRELSFFIVFSIAVFAPLYLYTLIRSLIESFVSISMLYEKVKFITDYVNITYDYFETLLCYFVPFILINLLLNGFLYLIIFRRIKVKRKEITGGQRFFGGVLGLVVGVELSIAMLILLNGVVSFDLTGPVTEILKLIPGVVEAINQTSQAISGVA